MHLSNSRPTGLLLLGIVFSCLALHVPAIPFHGQLTRPHSAPQLQPFATKHTRPWARVRDWIVETWWPFSYSIVHRDTLSSNHALTSGPLNELLLSQYGGEIVLRFNISTQDEASNLAEASQILFLDVWEYTNDWVDIRLSQDVVSYDLLPYAVDIANSGNQRFLRFWGSSHNLFSTLTPPRCTGMILLARLLIRILLAFPFLCPHYATVNVVL